MGTEETGVTMNTTSDPWNMTYIMLTTTSVGVEFRNNYTLLQEWNTRLANLFLPLDVLFVFIAVLGFTGNLVVCFVYRCCMQGKIQDRFFIPLLAIMDALSCLFGPIISLALSIRPVTFYGDVICKLSIFAFRVVLNSSVLLTLVIAIQRYRKVCRPFGEPMTIKRCKIASVVSIAISTVIAFPNFIFFGEIRIQESIRNSTVIGHRCGLRVDDSKAMATVIEVYQITCFVIVVGIVIAMIVMYTCVGKKIYKQTKRVENARRSTGTTSCSESDSQTPSFGSNGWRHHFRGSKRSRSSSLPDSVFINKTSVKFVSSSVPTSPTSPLSPTGSMSHPKSKQKRAQSVSRRYTLLFMAISFFFVISYLPTLTANVFSKQQWDTPNFWIDEHNSDDNKRLYTYLFFTYFINHVANPFFYGFFDSSFRRRITKALRCKCLEYRFGN